MNRMSPLQTRSRPAGVPASTPPATDEERRALERIDRAQEETPFCSCGLPTLIAPGTGGLWLECESLSRVPAGGPLGRWISRVTVALHTRRLVVEEAALAA